MFNKLPDWRWAEVQKAVEKKLPPTDSFLREVYDVLNSAAQNPAIIRAIEIHSIPVYRDTVVSFFLSGATIDQIVTGIEVPANELIVFEQLFVDSHVFRNRLEWKAYAEHYADTLADSKVGRDEVLSGVLYGPVILQKRWKKGNQIIEISTKEVLAEHISLAHSYAMTARSVSIMDPVAKEAFKWSTAAARGAIAGNNVQIPEELEGDAIAAIEQRKATMTKDEAGLGLDKILH